VHKVVQWYDANGESNSNLLDVFDMTVDEPIRIMQISQKVFIFYSMPDKT
jgi:hypothetical protein